MAAACEGEIKWITDYSRISSTTSGLCYSPKYSFSPIPVLMCEAAGEVSTCLTCSHLTGQWCFLDSFLNWVNHSAHRKHSSIVTGQHFKKVREAAFCLREHYANSVVKHIGTVLPFASAVLADSMGAFSLRSEHRGLVLDRERFSCSLCCHMREMSVDLSLNLLFA